MTNSTKSYPSNSDDLATTMETDKGEIIVTLYVDMISKYWSSLAVTTSTFTNDYTTLKTKKENYQRAKNLTKRAKEDLDNLCAFLPTSNEIPIHYTKMLVAHNKWIDLMLEQETLSNDSTVSFFGEMKKLKKFRSTQLQIEEERKLARKKGEAFSKGITKSDIFNELTEDFIYNKFVQNLIDEGIDKSDSQKMINDLFSFNII